MDSMTDQITLDVKGLFGLYDYTLQTLPSGNPLILTGPNGYGKTTLLSILRNLKARNIVYFMTLPFDNIILSRGDCVLLSVTSVSNNEDEDDENPLDKELVFADADSELLRFTSDDLAMAIRSPQIYTNIRSRLSSSDRYTEYETFSRIEQYSEKIFDYVVNRKKSNLYLALAALPEINLVQADRLRESLNYSNTNIKDTSRSELSRRRPVDAVSHEEIVNISEDLRIQMRQAHGNFLLRSQKSDKEFVNNILTNNDSILESEYLSAAEEVTGLISRLNKYGLVEKIPMPEYSDAKSFILKSYIQDLRDNLNVFAPILKKLETFNQLLAKKHFTGKVLEISRRYGLRAISSADKSFIELERLSSGEKNQLIMLYDLIFRVPDNSILLIDEPELSLHVAWQMDFLDDLTIIARDKSLQVIVATHSPQIIGEHWEDCYDLYEVNNPAIDNEQHPESH